LININNVYFEILTTYLYTIATQQLIATLFFKVGDGTTSVILLAVEFLRQIKPLVEEGVHPQILIKGFRKATQLVRKI